MSVNITIGDEIIEYPETGDINYGEEATKFAVLAAGVLAEVRNAGDIATTEVNLTGTTDGTYTTGTITNLSFDTAFVQRIEIKGFVTRTFTVGDDKVESFLVQGSYNGSEINFTVIWDDGDDTEFEFTVSAGQFGFKYLDDANDDIISIKFQAKTIIDTAFFE